MYARYMIWDALKFAFKRLIGFWISVIPRMIITFVITGVLSGAIVGALYYLLRMFALISAGWGNIAFIVAVVIALIPAFISVGIVWLRVALGKATNQPVPLWVTPIIFPTINIFFSSLFAGILALLGSIALIVPGIYISIRLFFAKFCIIDHEHGPIKALKCSWSLTRSAKSDIWKLSFILFGFMLLGFGVWYWMGMPAGNITPTEVTDVITNIKIAKIHWGQFIYGIINLVLVSLGVLFAAHLYAKLSQKEG